MSATNRSGSRTANASPLGSHATTDESSFRTISISFRGKGFDPVDGVDGLLAGDDVADKAGDTACPLGFSAEVFGSIRLVADCCVESIASNFIALAAGRAGLMVTTPATPAELTRGWT